MKMQMISKKILPLMIHVTLPQLTSYQTHRVNNSFINMPLRFYNLVLMPLLANNHALFAVPHTVLINVKFSRTFHSYEITTFVTVSTSIERM